jgi:hypothetical protein
MVGLVGWRYTDTGMTRSYHVGWMKFARGFWRGEHSLTCALLGLLYESVF